MKNKFLVTGASGFLGSHIADFLTNKRKNVVLFDLIKSKFLKRNQKMIIGNIKNLDDLTIATKNIDTVFHFAASADLFSSNEEPFKTLENNIIGTVSLLRACVINKVKKIIFASSIYARSEQGGIYSTTKLSSEMIIERICKKYKLNFVVLRFGTVYGERANNFNTVQKFINSAKKNKKIFRETKGNEIRSYIHVKDVAKITYKCIQKKHNNKYYNIFGNQRIRVKELLNTIKKYKPELKIIYAKKDKKMYNYKKNPFTYKLRPGQLFKLKKYISIKKGIKELI